MRDVWGLLVALLGLFIVWLWATGRAAAVWQSIVSANATTASPNAASTVNFNPYALFPATGNNTQTGVNGLQVSPFQFPNIPTYIPTVGSTVFNEGANGSLYNFSVPYNGN